MAPPRSTTPKPGRALLALLAVMAALTGLMFLNGQTTPKLALDLQGGTSVTLTAIAGTGGKAPTSDQMNQAVSIIRNRVNGLGVSEAEVAKQGSNIIIVQVPGKGQAAVVAQVGTTAKLQFRQVFAESAGTPAATSSPTPSVTPSGAATPKGTATPNAKVTGSASPSPKGRVLSQALAATATPSAAASSAAKASASSAAKAAATPSASATPSPPAPVPAPTGLASVPKAVLLQYETANCTGRDRKLLGSNDETQQWVASCDQNGQSKYLLGPVRVKGEQISSASAMPPNPTAGQTSWEVNMTFKSLGAQQFLDVTTDAYNAYKKDPTSPQQQVAIVLDGQTVSAPTITNGPIAGGTAQIYGPASSFTQAYATQLANVLNYGALPLDFQQSAIEQVSPTLGQDQLNAGLAAGGIGLVLVVLYCLLYYRALGMVAISSLAVAAGITYVSVALLGQYINFRLSLEGIAGLIVAIGITADSFVVYFERLRDEVREGRSLRSAVERGWQRARRTIIVADAVSFLAALVLYLVSIGSVKGFAFTLGLTTLIDVAVVFLFTKPTISWLARFRFFGQGHPMSGLDPRRLGAKTKVTVSPVTKEA